MVGKNLEKKAESDVAVTAVHSFDVVALGFPAGFLFGDDVYFSYVDLKLLFVFCIRNVDQRSIFIIIFTFALA